MYNEKGKWPNKSLMNGKCDVARAGEVREGITMTTEGTTTSSG
jgi:hypothetical protein